LGEIVKGSENPTCIRCVKVEAVCAAIERVLVDKTNDEKLK